jgi:hypothetical protein
MRALLAREPGTLGSLTASAARRCAAIFSFPKSSSASKSL